MGLKRSEKISESIEIGRINTLKIYKKSEYGLFLRSGDMSEILLPNAYVEKEMRVGESVKVFCYHDSQDRPVVMLDEYGLFEVVDYRSYGAFVKWGLPKDLFVPLSQQKEYFRIGEKKVLRVCRDVQTGRLYATQKLGRYFTRDMSGLKPGQKMSLIILAKTPMGYKVIADNRYEGMLFDNEVFEELAVGDRREGYITKVRIDRKLDISLRPYGIKAKREEACRMVLDALERAGGSLAADYKSSPETVRKLFGLNRKLFKQALTELIDSETIYLRDGKIESTDKIYSS